MINEWCAYDDVNVEWSGMVGYGDFSFTHYIGVLGTPGGFIWQAVWDNNPTLYTYPSLCYAYLSLGYAYPNFGYA